MLVKLSPWLMPALALVIAALYMALAKATSSGPQWLILDLIDNFKIFGIDDSYRYYAAQNAWRQPELYAWSFVLPIGLILDGILATVLNGDLYLMRCAHALAAAGSLWLTYAAGCRLGAPRWAMILAVLLLAFMPLYAFVSISFLAESWLTLLATATLYTFVRQQYRLCAAIGSLLPLTRPEGLFLIIPLAVFLLRHWRLRELALLGLPGLLYLIHLIVTLSPLSIYWDWRLHLRTLINVYHAEGFYRASGFFSTFNPFWTLPALATLFLPPLRRLWPIWAGALLSATWFIVSILRELSFYEARYFAAMLPLLTISWALFYAWLSSRPAFAHTQKGLATLFIVASLLLGAEHLLQFDPVKAQIGDGERWPVAGPKPIGSNFSVISPEEMQARASTLKTIDRLIRQHSRIDTLVLFDTELFYHIDPKKLPRHVRVVYAPASSNIALDLFGGSFFSMHPEGRQYAYYNFRLPTVEHRPEALYIGPMNCPLCKPTYQAGSFQVFRFAYATAMTPTDLPKQQVEAAW